jgi:hypothetical protein
MQRSMPQGTLPAMAWTRRQKQPIRSNVEGHTGKLWVLVVPLAFMPMDGIGQ